MSLLQDLFITVVNMSITASYVAIGVILVRLLLKKAPKAFSYILWIPVLFRLVCPFSFDSAFSFFNLINLNTKQGSGVSEFVPQNIGLMYTPAIQSGIGSIDSAANASLPAAVPAASADPMQIWMAVFSLVWIFGVIALLIYSIVSYARIKRKLQTATLVDGNVFETDAIGTAFVCGFIRPKIYVPANIGDANLSYILEHERTHILRKDYLIKPLAFLALILHWFNPLMWLCFALMCRDMEMSCDESVLHKLGDSAKGGYSGSLLALSVKRKGLLAANPLAFGESYVKTRIKNVLNFKKPAFWVIMIAVAAVCSAVVAFTANPFKEGTISAEDKRKLADVVSEYYMKADPANKGTLKIYNIKKFGSSYLVLTQKYRGEGESFSVLFLVDDVFKIVAKAQGDIPISPCFSANVVKYQGKSIVYGNFKNKKWNPQTDLVTDVQIDFIKIMFEDGTYVREQISMDKGYIVVVDTLSNIRNLEVYNNKGELQSDLINESACSEYDFIQVENENVSRQEEEKDSNTLFDKSKVQEYWLETVVINDCLSREGPGENYKSIGSLKYGDIVLAEGRYGNWVLCTADNGRTEFWIEAGNLVDEQRHTEYNLGIITADEVKVGTVTLYKGNLVQVLKRGEDKTCVTIRVIDINVGKTGWIKNSDYVPAKEGVYFNQAYLRKGTAIYEEPSPKARQLDDYGTKNLELFVNIEKEQNGWVLISTYGPVNGWVRKENIFIPMPDTMTDEEQKALQVVKEYFDAFGEADYDKMRTLATENHNRNLVHDGDVWGMKWAKAKQIELIRDPRFLGVENSEPVLVFNVSVDMETVKTSAQYPATQTSFYVVLIKGDDGSWRVDRYATG